MKDVCDGVYVGEMTAEETIQQFIYRILIHETVAGLVLEDPVHYPSRLLGDFTYHMWAINGYNEGIRHIRESNPVEYVEVEKLVEVEKIVEKVVYKCTLETIIKAILILFRR